MPNAPLMKLFYKINTFLKKIIFIIRIKQIAEGCNRQFGLGLKKEREIATIKL